MNRAMDYVINDILVESKVGKYNAHWLHDTTIGTHTDDVLTVYRRIFDQSKGGGGKQGKSGQSGFDAHLAPGAAQGQDPTQAAAGRNDMQWKTAIAGAVAAGRAMGKMPAALDRALTDELEPTVDWRDKIHSFFARKPGGGSFNWQKPDRRLVVRDIIAPSRSGFGSGPVVCAIDTSGSIGQKQLDLFFGELAGILEDVRPSMLYIMFCDAKVHRVDELDSGSDLLDVRQAGAPGGGGTSFKPVFDEIESMDILWGDISGGKVAYPFGEVVELPEM
jgi:predicted metal-dependent peptidase